MNCETVIDLFSEYIDNQLDELTLINFEKHMEQCQYCRHEFYKFEKVILHIKSIKPTNPPPYLKQNIMQNIYNQPTRNNKKFTFVLPYAVSIIIFFIVFFTLPYYNISLLDNSSNKFNKLNNIKTSNIDIQQPAFNNKSNLKKLDIDTYLQGIPITITSNNPILLKQLIIDYSKNFNQEVKNEPYYLEIFINQYQFLHLQQYLNQLQDLNISFIDLDSINDSINSIINQNLIPHDGIINFKIYLN